MQRDAAGAAADGATPPARFGAAATPSVTASAAHPSGTAGAASLPPWLGSAAAAAIRARRVELSWRRMRGPPAAVALSLREGLLARKARVVRGVAAFVLRPCSVVSMVRVAVQYVGWVINYCKSLPVLPMRPPSMAHPVARPACTSNAMAGALELPHADSGTAARIGARA